MTNGYGKSHAKKKVGVKQLKKAAASANRRKLLTKNLVNRSG